MYNQALELAEHWGGQSSIALCLVQWGRARLLYEWNDLDEARRALQESIRIGELWRNAYLLVPAYGLSAMVKQGRGQVGDAVSMIRRAEQVTLESYSPLPTLGSLAGYQIALWIAQNNFQAITHWEQRHDSEWQAQVGRARDTLAIVLARARIAWFYQQHDDSALSQAWAMIQPALEKAQASGMIFNVVSLLILEALALYAQGGTASAIAALKRALAIAEPEYYVRSFLDVGKPMEEFLLWSLESQSLSEPHLRVYVSKLLSQFSADASIESSQSPGDTPSELLTDRELEVLQLVSQGLSNEEISQRLYLALDTVKGHNRKIFSKLQVHRRTEAVARARELGLM
jgi:LuxR family maltose regulon positive regulatory protein